MSEMSGQLNEMRCVRILLTCFPKNPKPKCYIQFVISNCAFGLANLCTRLTRKVVKWKACGCVRGEFYCNIHLGDYQL